MTRVEKAAGATSSNPKHLVGFSATLAGSGRVARGSGSENLGTRAQVLAHQCTDNHRVLLLEGALG